MSSVPREPSLAGLWPESAPAGGAVIGADARPAGGPSNPWIPMPERTRYLLIAALVVFTLVCTVGALANTSQNAASPLLALSTLVYLAAVAWPLVRFDQDRQGWFHPLVFGTLVIMVRVLPRSLSLFINGLDEHAVLPLSPEELTRLVAYANFLNALALICTYAGFCWVRRPPLPSLRFAPPKRFWPAVAGMGALSLCALALLIRMSGSLSQHILNLSLNSAAKVFIEDPAGLGLLGAIGGWFALALTMALAYRPELLRKPLFLALGLVALGFVYLASGKRSLLLAPVAIGAIVWMLRMRRVPVGRMLLLGAGAFAAFSLLLVVRQAASLQGGAKSLDDLAAVVGERAGESFGASLEELSYRAGSYSSLYPILHFVPSETPLLWGQTYLVILARPIPRVLWPDKPRGTDYLTGVTFFNAIWGIPPGPVGEAYWNFHIPGVVAVFFLTGIFLRWLHNLFLRYGEHGLMVFFYAFTIFIFSPTENTVTQWLLALLPMLLFAAFTGAVRRGSPAGG